MRRVLIILLGIVLLTISLGLLALIPLAQTSWGMALADRISRPIIERQVSEQLGSEISYAPLAGRFPNRIVVRDLELSANGETWARADRFILRWNVWALLGRRIKVDELVMVDGAFLTYPPLPEKPEKPEESTSPIESPAEPSSKPLNLPEVMIESVVLSDFVLGEAILGQAYSLSLFGSGTYVAPSLAMEVQLQTSEGTDRAALSVVFDGNDLDADLSVISEETGLISTLIQSEGRTEAAAYATGPLTDLTAEIGLSAATYGILTGELSASIEQLDQLSAELFYQPGPFLPTEAASAIGDQLHLSVRGQRSDESLHVHLEDMSGAFGAIAGDLTAALSQRLELEVQLSGQLEPALLEPYGASMLAGPLSLSAQAGESDQGYSYAGTLNAGDVSLSLREGRTDGASLFAGDVRLEAPSVTVDDPRLGPILSDGIEISTGVRYTDDRVLLIQRLRAALGNTLGRRIIATADGQFAVEDGSFDGDIDLRAEPQALALLLGQGEFADPLDMRVEANGETEDFGIVAEVTLPAGTVNGAAIAAGELQSSIGGLPQTPKGTVQLTSADQSYAGQARFEMEARRLILPMLDLSAGGLSLSAQIDADLETLASEASLTINAEPGTTLITGQSLSGNAQLNATTSKDLGQIDVTLESEGLQFAENELLALSLEARGPKSALNYNLSAQDMSAGPLFFTSVASKGLLDIGTGSNAEISSLELGFPGQDSGIVLLQPTVLSWGKGLSLSITKLAYLADGVVSFAGDFQPGHWRAEVQSTAFPIPESDILVDLNVNLDTDGRTPAEFSVAARHEKDETPYAVATKGLWDGQAVTASTRMLQGDEEELGTVETRVPLELNRGERLSVSLPDEEIRVALNYLGQLEPIFSFLPMADQPLSGGLRANVDVGGTLSAPSVAGEVKLENARFEERDVGLTLSNLNGGIDFTVSPEGTKGMVALTGSGASGRENSVRLSGLVALEGQSSDVDIHLVLDRAQLAKSPELELRASSDLRLTGSLQDLRLSGPMTFDELDLTIPEIESGGEVPSFAPVNVVRIDAEPDQQIQKVRPPQEPPLEIILDLAVKATDGIFIRGRGLDSEWSADLVIEGSTSEPRIGGEVSSVEGELNLAGRKFNLDEGQISFQRTADIDPLLNVEASTEAGTGSDAVTAIASIKGNSSDPVIAFSSTPTLPQDDVLALILFGRPAVELGASEALQLAQAAATLSGALGGGPGVSGALRSGLGLDRLSFDPTARAVEVGKYVSDDIYVSARQSLTQAGTIISIVYQLSRFVSLETTLQPNGAQTVGASYRRDY